MKSLILALSFVMLGLLPTAHAKDPVFVKCADMDDTNWDEATTINITLRDYDILPEDLTLKACQPYRFVVVNSGEHHHNFYSKNFFQTLMAWTDVGVEALPQDFKALSARTGQPAELLFIPTAVGTFKFKCSDFGHDVLGMKGEIEVVRTLR